MSTTEKNKKNQVEDDFDLLDLMMQDTKKLKDIYRPGPHWLKRTKASVNEIKNFGLSDFRGIKSSIATSYGDNAFVDTRGSYNFGIRVLLLIIYRYIFPFNRLFNSQVGLTLSYFNKAKEYEFLYLINNKRVIFLLSKYKLTFETTRGGCLSFEEFDGANISFQYLKLLDTLDNIDNKINLSSKKTFFEIGGGFGINVHLMIELFKIKKIIYLDIAPNLYVGTQYLKSFYGEKVIDYKKSKDLKYIEFSENDEIEIFCITPMQIEKIKSKIDMFHSAHSFSEMPENVIQNYAKKIERILSNNSTISLVQYDGYYDLNTTISPDKLPTYFTMNSTKYIIPTLTPDSSNIHFIIQ